MVSPGPKDQGTKGLKDQGSGARDGATHAAVEVGSLSPLRVVPPHRLSPLARSHTSPTLTPSHSLPHPRPPRCVLRPAAFRTARRVARCVLTPSDQLRASRPLRPGPPNPAKAVPLHAFFQRLEFPTPAWRRYRATDSTPPPKGSKHSGTVAVSLVSPRPTDQGTKGLKGQGSGARDGASRAAVEVGSLSPLRVVSPHRLSPLASRPVSHVSHSPTASLSSRPSSAALPVAARPLHDGRP